MGHTSNYNNYQYEKVVYETNKKKTIKSKQKTRTYIQKRERTIKKVI